MDEEFFKYYPHLDNRVTEVNYIRPIRSIYQNLNDNVEYWEPKIKYLTSEEIRRKQKEEERKSRYARRFRGK